MLFFCSFSDFTLNLNPGRSAHPEMKDLTCVKNIPQTKVQSVFYMQHICKKVFLVFFYRLDLFFTFFCFFASKYNRYAAILKYVYYSLSRLMQALYYELA